MSLHEVYQRAESLLEHNWPQLVRNGQVSPHWLPDGESFWYEADTDEGGKEFVRVEPARGRRGPAFDHDRFATALSAATGRHVSPSSLPITDVALIDGGVEFEAFDGRWGWDGDLRRLDAPVARAPGLNVSPNGRWRVARRDHNLWVSSEGEPETALSTDGHRDSSYACQPDALALTTLARRFGQPGLPPILRWSPASDAFVTHRTVQAGLRTQYLVDAMPPDGSAPQLHEYRYPMPGDEAMVTCELVVFDMAAGGRQVPAQTDPLLLPILSPILVDWVWWGDERTVYFLDQTRDLRRLSLRAFDRESGAVTTLVHEEGEPRIEPGQVPGVRNVRVLGSGAQVLWWSQRDGWGHLYLYDVADPAEPRQLTSGDWLVQRVLHVDEAESAVYFVALGLVPGDPYRRQVCRVGFDGSGFRILVDDGLDHEVTVAPSGTCFVDVASARDVPPVTTVRDWTGTVIVALEEADISGLLATGWRPPEAFSATAADGSTQVHGLLFLPPDFDPSRKYPVLDSPYPGPQKARVTSAFGGQRWADRGAQAVAALGFVVLAMDGRGTPGRSRALHDEYRDHYDTAGFLQDHVAALNELARTRPWLDLDRVGIFGNSGGGYATVRAMVQFPELFKVGVAACGNHDQRYYHLGFGEFWFGPLDDDRYVRSSNVELAHRLEGRLLLIHGGMDDNVHPHLTLRLVERLIEANKDFDLLIVPGAEHHFAGYEAYVTRRQWDYLVRHLAGLEPPAGYQLRPFPRDRGLLGF